jgi:hypothetical protein
MCRSCFSPILLNSELHSSQGGQLFDAPPAQPSRRGFEATAVATAATFAADAGADVIFRGGKIIPLPGAAPVQGLAVGSGKILALLTSPALAAEPVTINGFERRTFGIPMNQRNPTTLSETSNR